MMSRLLVSIPLGSLYFAFETFAPNLTTFPLSLSLTLISTATLHEHCFVWSFGVIAMAIVTTLTRFQWSGRISVRSIPQTHAMDIWSYCCFHLDHRK